MLSFLKNLLKNGEAIASLAIIAAILGIGALAHHYKDVADELQVELWQAQQREKTCTEAVAALETEAREREAAAKKALDEATKQANKYALRADELLRRPAAVPGDDCASARVRAQAWLKGRGQ